MHSLLEKADIYFIISLLLAIWSLATGILWIYWAALYVSYPAAILSLYIWSRLRQENRNYYIVIPVIVVLGLIFSIGVLLMSLLK